MAAAMSPATARRIGAKEGEIVRIEAGDAAVELPALVQPGMADSVLATTLGYGRTRAGAAGSGVGVNASPLSRSGIAERQ